MTLYEYQNYLKCVLYFFDNFCRNNNIKYTVIDGSLIGAVRNKGIIPWDGDVDVALTPVEFEKLKKAFELYDGRYYLNYLPDHIYYSKRRKHDFPTITAKIIDKKCSSGIFGIDVFTIDFLGNDLLYAEKTIKLYKHFDKIMRFGPAFHCPELKINGRLNVKGILVRIMYPLFKFVSLIFSPIFKKKYSTFRKERIDNNSEKSLYFTIEPYLGRFGIEKNNILDGGYIDLPFEHFKVMAVKNYEVYLKATYGDYMQMPPVDKRVPYPSEDLLVSCEFVMDNELRDILKKI